MARGDHRTQARILLAVGARGRRQRKGARSAAASEPRAAMPARRAPSHPAATRLRRNSSASACGNSSLRFGAPVAVLELAGIEAAIGHDHPVRNAEQLRIRELDAGPRVAVVEQHFDARAPSSR